MNIMINYSDEYQNRNKQDISKIIWTAVFVTIFLNLEATLSRMCFPDKINFDFQF